MFRPWISVILLPTLLVTRLLGVVPTVKLPPIKQLSGLEPNPNVFQVPSQETPLMTAVHKLTSYLYLRGHQCEDRAICVASN